MSHKFFLRKSIPFSFLIAITTIGAIILPAKNTLAATLDRVNITGSGPVVGGGFFINWTLFNGNMDNPGVNIEDFHMEITTPGVQFTSTSTPQNWMDGIDAPTQKLAWWNSLDPAGTGDIRPNRGLTGFGAILNSDTFEINWNTTSDRDDSTEILQGGSFSFQNGEKVPEPATILGSATALGVGALLKRGNSKKQNKS